MKEKIINLLSNTNEVPLSAFRKHIPSIEGDYEYYVPSNSNIMLVSNVNMDFCEAIHDLLNNRILDIERCDIHVVLFEGGEVYDYPIAEDEYAAYSNTHWLPVMIKRGENFVASK